jgi:2-methylcitrate dehydratase PrpD
MPRLATSVTPLDTLGDAAAGITIDDLPAAVRDQAVWVLADTIAAIAAGSAEPPLQALAAAQSPNQEPPAPLVGLGRCARPGLSALINGAAGTFMELDEGNSYAKGHPAIHVIPAALAAAAHCGASASAFLSGVVAGYEVAARVGAASRMRKDMHPHGTWGTIGAAAAAARVSGMDGKGMSGVIRTASSLTIASSKQTMLEGAVVRNIYSGLANQNGLLAVDLYAAGFSGERDGLCSVFGKVVSEQFDSNSLSSDLGEAWYITKNYFKMHACCRYNHATLDAIDLLAQRGQLPAADDIQSIEVTTYEAAAEMAVTEPSTVLGSKFSVPFAVATRLRHGHSRYSAFTEQTIHDAATLGLARKVILRAGEGMVAQAPAKPASVVVRAVDGRSVSADISVNNGEHSRPYTRADLESKFLELTTRIWPKDHCRTLLDATLSLGEGASSLAAWMKMLGQPAVKVG